LRSYDSIVEHLVSLRIIDECHNDKTILLYCFIDFTKKFNTVPRNNLWNILDKIKVIFKLKDVVIKLYENIIANFRNIEGSSK